MFIIKTAGCLATRNFPGPRGEAGEQGACSLPAGAMGDPGDEGFPGPRGLKGDKGEPASRFDRPRPGEECRCPIGPPGTKGTQAKTAMQQAVTMLCCSFCLSQGVVLQTCTDHSM